MVEIVYIAHAIASGGRNGTVRTDDGALRLTLATPGTPKAKPGTTNPEQLFACAYASCFGSALEFTMQQQKVTAPRAEVKADITLNQNSNGFFLSAAFHITLPGIEKDIAENLVKTAHQLCPYARATRDNIEVTFKVNDEPLALAA